MKRHQFYRAQEILHALNEEHRTASPARRKEIEDYCQLHYGFKSLAECMQNLADTLTGQLPPRNLKPRPPMRPDGRPPKKGDIFS